MSKAWPMVSLGEVLRPSVDSHPVKAESSYPNFGIYSFGRGLFPDALRFGAFHECQGPVPGRKGRFVYSRLFAFEGAYGLVSEEYDGCFVSNEYPMFECVPDEILPKFLALYFQTPKVWERVARYQLGWAMRGDEFSRSNC